MARPSANTNELVVRSVEVDNGDLKSGQASSKAVK
jgi:hypothetical protein